MSSNACYDFLLERIYHPETIVLNEPGKTYTCGRGKENQIQCVSLTVSRQHCSFFRNDHEIYVIDLGSSNGLFVNEIKQTARHMVKLKDNDIIGIGCQNAKNKSNEMFIYKLRCIIKNKTPTDRTYTAMAEQPLRKDLPTGSTDRCCHLSAGHNSNESSDLVLSNEISERSTNTYKTNQIKMFNEKLDNGACKIISNEEVELTIDCAERSMMRQNKLHLKSKYNNKSPKKNDISKPNKSSEINNAEGPLIQKSPSNEKNELQPVKENEMICIDLSNDIDTEIVQQNKNNKTKNICLDKKIYHANNPVKTNKINDTNIHADISNNIKISELSTNTDKTCQIVMLNEKVDNEACSKIILNKKIELTDNCRDRSMIKQNNVHLDTNYNNKCQKKNISKHKNSSEINSAEDPINKTNEFQPLKINEMVRINLFNIDTEIVQQNSKDKTKNICVDKQIYRANNAVETNNINDASTHTDINMKDNDMKILLQQDHFKNVKTNNEVQDNLKEHNASLIKENKLNKSKDAPKNLVYNGNYYIKMEDELIISDDEGEIINSIDKSNNYIKSKVKLEQFEEKPKLRFSEIDIVNISDDEENLFPSSQLFDSNLDINSVVKKEIKQEYHDNHDEDVNRADDIEIIISDSEDEFNIWLHKLSRSQMPNDTTSRNDNIVNTIKTVKDETSDIEIIDTDIQNTIKESTDSINNTLNQLSVSIKTNINNETKEHINNITKKCTNTEHFKNSDKLDIVKEHGPDITLDVQITGIDNNISNKVQENNDETSHSLNKRQNIINNDRNDNVFKYILHSKKIKSDTRKRPQIIDAPHMPVKKRRRKDISDMNTEEGVEKKGKKFFNLKTQMNKKLLHDSNDHIPPDALQNLPLSKEEKKRRAEKRKSKLKMIAEEDKKVSKKEPVRPSAPKPKAKVSLKSRSDSLIDEIRSKIEQNKISVKRPLNNKQSKNNTANIDTRKDDNALPSISDLKTKETIPNYKETLNNVTKHLEQFLNVTDVNPAQLNEINKSHTNLNKPENIENVTDETIHTTEDKNIEASTSYDLKDEVKIKNNVRIEKGNCSFNRQETSESKKKGKNVSFNNNLEVREYEIESQNILKKISGKDAPIPVDKLSSKKSVEINSPKIEDFLLRIFLWNPVWLEEQQRFKQMPPILKENELHPMLTYYRSYIEYYKIAKSLLLLEIWYGITKEFETLEKNTKRPTIMCSVVGNSFKSIHAASVNMHLSSLVVQVLITKENLSKQAHPYYGDLIVLEYEKKKHIFQKVFGYVTNMHQTVITSFTNYNKDLENYVKNPYALLIYTIMTRNIEENFIINRIQRIRTVTYLRSNIRMVQAIQYLPQSPLINLILYPKIESFQLPLIEVHNHQLITKDKLNQKQLEVVGRVTGAVLQKEPKICLIQGPPGTGKSKVIVNIITEILYGNNRYQNNKSAVRILVCAPSNAAIDEIVLRLLAIRATIKQNRFKMVRIGKPETMHLTVKDISLTELGKRDVKRMATNYSTKYFPTESFEEEKQLLEARINALKYDIANSQNLDDVHKKHLELKLTDMNTKYELLENHKPMNEMNAKELEKLQRIAERRILECADIITSTLSSCYTNQMESIFGANKEKISVCIVDEATQCCEAENLIPLLLGVNTLVLVGDPNQLPATIISQQAKKFGLDKSLFARIQYAFHKQMNNPIIMLTTQYRMAYAISYFPNKYFYGGKIKNEVENSQTFPFHNYRVFNINSYQNNDKFSNTHEADFISNIILCMMTNYKLKKWDFNISIGVLTPYNNQKCLILQKVNEKISIVSEIVQKRFTIEINTVDSFQGQERDIILMSCVRSHGIGFLSDPQRLCVALTRAKYCLILCGNFHTFMRDQMWNALISDSKLRKIYYNINSNASLDEIKHYIIK